MRLDDVVLRALEKEPARRYQQASEVKTSIDTIASSAPTLPATRVMPQRASRRKPIHALVPILLYIPQAVLLWLVERSLWAFGPFAGMGMGPFGGFGGPVGAPDPFGAFRWLMLHTLALGVAYTSWAILHHACWKALPEQYRTTTPGMATGLLFVPVFNFYWVFVSLGRLASGFEAWGNDHPDRTIKLAGGLAIAKAASFVAYWTIAWLPGLAAIVALTDIVLFALYYRAVAHNANGVLAAEATAPAAPR